MSKKEAIDYLFKQEKIDCHLTDLGIFLLIHFLCLLLVLYYTGMLPLGVFPSCLYDVESHSFIHMLEFEI